MAKLQESKDHAGDEAHDENEEESGQVGEFQFALGSDGNGIQRQFALGCLVPPFGLESCQLAALPQLEHSLVDELFDVTAL